MPDRPLSVVFVHGWSVTDTKTYGRLPRRLSEEAGKVGLAIDVREIWLGEYVSFHDEVRVEDVSRAVEAAVQRDLADVLARGDRFAAITHSTGGPVMRDWWHRYHGTGMARSPMSHLVMLAPANFGSALAQLGKSRLSRLKTWFEQVEPGTGVLDWLELGSPESWALGKAWIEGVLGEPDVRSVLPFVLSGQSIDRSLYDVLNSYTGENGSDGVVRVASANLNAAWVRLVQQPGDGAEETELAVEESRSAPRTAFRLIPGVSHSGTDMGIMRSVQPRAGAKRGAEVVDAILRCLAVTTKAQYTKLCDAFEVETEAVHEEERVEVTGGLLFGHRTFVHDRMTQVIFRVVDSEGNAVTDFDLVLTGAGDDPYRLPPGFSIDRQCNRRSRNTITYFLDHDVMKGSDEVVHDGQVVRAAQPGLAELGLHVNARPSEGFVHYAPARLHARADLIETILQADQTVLVEIVLRRIVHENVARFSRGTKTRDFRKVEPGQPLD